MLNKGCEGYLAFLAEGEKERPKPEDMVNELSDAFQEDLPGLHPIFFLLFLAGERRGRETNPAAETRERRGWGN